MTESCDSMLEQATKALKDYFGHADFRANQRELIEQVLDGRDVLAVMPTGAGKSLVYQVPAIVSEGLAVVVSPLISLMKDQVNALTQAGVRAAFLNSSISPAEQAEVLEYAASGSCKLLYVAPERLDAPRFLALCKTTKISLVAVDEAHCVSQWGQDFRPSYLGIAAFIGSLPNRPPVCALTATATPEVQKDIAHALGLVDPFSLVSGFDRPNLYFGVERPDPKAKRACLLRLVRERSGQAGIVYCSTRQAVEDVCDLLCEGGFEATRYHAGLAAAERHANQEDFLFDRKPLMVATNAFGMGIDKSNVSFVIHYNMPSDVESYYQEAGRAGRDGEPADCILLYSGQDVHTAEFLIERSREAEDDALAPAVRQHLLERDRERLRRMTFYATTTECLRRTILRYFGEEAPLSCGHCGNCDTTFEQVDATVEAQKILSCVYRLSERGLHFGRVIIAAVLTGSKSEKIDQFRLDTLSTYGIMADATAARVRQLTDALIERGHLRTDPARYNALFLTPSGNALMRGRDTFVLRLPREKAPAARAAESSAAMDQDLFGRLRALRTALAQKAHVPPYVIFSNATLSDMAARQPITEFELLAVRGVGEAKARRYGGAFLEEIKRYLQEKA